MANMTTAQQGGALTTPAQFQKAITDTVMKRVAELDKNGGINVPKGYSAANQINLAMLSLAEMKDKRTNEPVLATVSQTSVANALLKMCILGLSLEKKQCVFIKYGNELQFQPEYHGNILLAKRAGAGDPQAQVIYEGDTFEYIINPKTGKKEVVRHEQRLENIDNSKIIGAWCMVPYADHPEVEPKVEVMTIAEIRQSWMQGATKGQSGAHNNFTQEMCKKTVISRACKLFLSTTDDAAILDDRDDLGPDEQAEMSSAPAAANSTAALFEALPERPKQAARPEPVAAPAPAPAPEPMPAEAEFNDDFFSV